MKKKLYLGFIILTFIAGELFAQESVEVEKAKNTIALSLGSSVNYERALNNYFSLLAEASYTFYFIGDEWAAAVKGRWYPWGKTFFLELGLGYGNTLGYLASAAGFVTFFLSFGQVNLNKYADMRIRGFLIGPALGWKIDIGKANGFVLPINLGIDFTIGSPNKESLFIDFVPYLKIGLGYSF
ncbi:hypothetical protein FACS1894172_20220 [Spirochaetia bacterium]|nr:hypothetical protein FACS1894164_16960 [Spirochaetia bacterium]GHU36960.1 hypothetical protein FACS1894172_20220 [Spirochaetia bacterium]